MLKFSGALRLLEKAYLPAVLGVDQNLRRVGTRYEPFIAEKGAGSSERGHLKCGVAPDLPTAAYSANDLVADSSSRERFFRTIDVTSITFDGNSNKIVICGSVWAEMGGNQPPIPRTLVLSFGGANLLRGLKECQFQFFQLHFPPSPVYPAHFKDKVLMQGKRSQEPCSITS
jgi:hypothetical protein